MLENKTVTIVGLGLMGGALAMGLRKQNPQWIGAYDIDEEVMEEALAQGVVDWGETSPEGAASLLARSDLVIFCLYPGKTVDFYKAHRDDFKENAVITDITGVKGILVRELLPILRPDLDFIMGHPMAGSEKEGFGGADDRIFKGRNYILVPRAENRESNLKWLRQIIYGLGFINIVEATPEVHDQKIAFTSQLCHVIACALIDSEEDLHISDYEGGSFCDLTRIAMINAPMWSELFVSNKEALLAQMDQFMDSMGHLREEIAASDEPGLQKNLESVRQKRVIMEIDRQNKAHRAETLKLSE